MDHLPNEIFGYLNILKWHYKFYKQMNGTRKYHPEWGNPDTKEHTGYVLTDKRILDQTSEYLRYNSQTTWSPRRPKCGWIGSS